MVTIIDYGVGNLFSLKSSLAYLGEEAVVTGDREAIEKAERIILPGVGAYADAAQKLKAPGLDQVLVRKAAEGTPIMGICLGMQLLLEGSMEYGWHEGLGLIPGQARYIGEAIRSGLKIPQIGWNGLRFPEKKHPIFENVQEGEHVYFVHSYYGANCPNVIADTEYGGILTAAIGRDNVCGCQFHPEKSGPVGLRILKSFCRWEGSV